MNWIIGEAIKQLETATQRLDRLGGEAEEVGDCLLPIIRSLVDALADVERRLAAVEKDVVINDDGEPLIYEPVKVVSGTPNPHIGPPAAPFDADKIALAKVWAKVHGKRPYSWRLDQFGWSYNLSGKTSEFDANNLDRSIYEAITEKPGSIFASDCWKQFRTEDAAYLALHDALAACGELPPKEEARCERCGWPLYENVKDGCTKESCSQRPLLPAPTPLEALAEKWEKQSQMDWTPPRKACYAECAAELRAVIAETKEGKDATV